MTSSNGKIECNVSFDDMPVERKKFCAKRRSVLHVVDPDEEEQEHDHVADECENIVDKESKPQLKSQSATLTNDAAFLANAFFMKFYYAKQIKKELQWDAINYSDSIDLGVGCTLMQKLNG